MEQNDLTSKDDVNRIDEVGQDQMVSISLNKLANLIRRGRDLEAELARYTARYGLTDEARRLFGLSKS